jgi:predicted lipoprotein with Yx(FWY)xxD motif
MLAAAGAALAVLAGCGSSKSSSATTASTASSTSSTAVAQKPAYGAGSTTAAGSAASTGGAAAGNSAAVSVTTKKAKVGTVLAVGPKRMTVYLFEADKGATSACSGACASVWPPVTTSGTASASGAAMSSALGTVTRPDGTKQVTYNGHPLYFFAKDKDEGDSYGQGVKAFGAGWYVMAPSGNKIDNS